MDKNAKQCYNCHGTSGSNNHILHGYIICDTCKSKLGLLQDKTIKRHFLSAEKAKQLDANHLSLEEDVRDRLVFLDKNYISKRIKLLHIQERLSLLK